jgi:hypothetical protein
MVVKKIAELLKKKDKRPASNDEASKKQEQRSFIRLEYPSTKRPKFIIGKDVTEVINISERGLKFTNLTQIPKGKFISGTIELSNKKSLKLSGTVVWSEGNEAGVLISGRIPYDIMEEQRTYIKKLR